jgi:hypothetical protein
MPHSQAIRGKAAGHDLRGFVGSAEIRSRRDGSCGPADKREIAATTFDQV